MSEQQALPVPANSQGQVTAGQGYVVFALGETLLGVELGRLLRIVRLAPITRVPRAPLFVMGVFNYRGQIVPAVDLRKRLGLPAAEYGAKARILIVELGARTAGLMVDATAGILRLPEKEIFSTPVGCEQIPAAYVTGSASQGEQRIVLLDLNSVLTWA
jgi:purine-binding chemotaxis protein CheW